MALGPRVDVVAVVGSSEMGAALNETCADMNGTRVDVHVGRLTDVRPGVDIFNSLDVLLLEVDPRNDTRIATATIASFVICSVPPLGCLCRTGGFCAAWNPPAGSAYRRQQS